MSTNPWTLDGLTDDETLKAAMTSTPPSGIEKMSNEDTLNKEAETQITVNVTGKGSREIAEAVANALAGVPKENPIDKMADLLGQLFTTVAELKHLFERGE